MGGLLYEKVGDVRGGEIELNRPTININIFLVKKGPKHKGTQ